ncbi:MAG: glycosyltransferase family 2 protein [Syntrophaceae bacterium]|nr:glycosyltransferase family 2 protein [Syntrophaceae bacterium]
MLFSVVIPLYNKADTVARAVQSVLDQTVQDYEIIVVNDGSEDNGPAIVESFNDSRIRLLHQKNAGVSAARNRGIEESVSDLIAFLDADDEWLPTYLEKIRELVVRFPDCGLYGTRYFYQNPDGKKHVAVIRGIPEDFDGILNDYFGLAARSHPPICADTACASKDALNRIGGFLKGLASGQDLLAWGKLAANFRMAYSMEPLAVYHLDNAATYRDKPSRVPLEHDIVGEEFKGLYEDSLPPLKNSLGRYCAHWHKMRCSCYLRLGMKRHARCEIRKGKCYSFDFPLFAYLGVSYLPETLIRRIFRLVMSIR